MAINDKINHIYRAVVVLSHCDAGAVLHSIERSCDADVGELDRNAIVCVVQCAAIFMMCVRCVRAQVNRELRSTTRNEGAQVNTSAGRRETAVYGGSVSSLLWGPIK